MKNLQIAKRAQLRSKSILLALLLCLSTSCSVKNDGPSDDELSFTSSIKEMADADFDLIPDSVDPDPLVANVPIISVTNIAKSKISYRIEKGHVGGEAEIGISHKDLIYKSTIAREIILRAMRSKLAQSSVDLGAINDENSWNSFIFTPWGNQTYIDLLSEILSSEKIAHVNYSGAINLRYNLKLSNLLYTSKVEKIIVSSRFLDIEGGLSDIFSHVLKDDSFNEVSINTRSLDSLKTLDFYNTYSYELDPLYLKDQLREHNKLVLSMSNFSFIRNAKRVQFLDFTGNLKQKLATIIISTKNKTLREFIGAGNSIKSSLEHLGYKVQLSSDGQLVALNDLSTSVIAPEDIRNPSHDFLDGFILASFNAPDLNDIAVAGQVYIFSHAKGSSVFKAKSHSSVLELFEFENETKLENIKEGDLLEISLTGSKFKKSTRTSVISTSIWGVQRQCSRAGDFLTSLYGVCIDQTGNFNCTINYESLSDYSLYTHVNFNSDLKNYSILINQKRVPLDQVLNFSSYNDGKALVATLRVTRQMLKNKDQILLYENSNSKRVISWGNRGFVSCKRRHQVDSFGFNTPSHGQNYSKEFTDLIKTKIQVKRTGAAR